MKNDVDKRVVEFEFDNSKFDKNVKKSTKTLNKLDETLQFKDVSKSLDEIKIKFSALDVVFASTVRNITDRVVNLGVRLVKSLSIDNLTAGWQKFGEKTIAVGTLMAQSLKVAGKTIEDYSEQMEVVAEQLDKLNWFTDETSYNFTDMVDNIGKFTAAGQDLDKSVEAMMGIANWAALSGQNAATASRAMYQLSQALGKGYVQLIDYKSIQNANMDTQEFRKTVLETAVAMGELTKEGENYLTKTGKKFTQNQFAEQLNAKWFTSDVLTASLKKYSAAVDKLYEITEKEGITASEAIELYGDQFDELAIKAFKAAQEARTFSDAINSVKDAVSTGWMTTAEMIFGSYDEAKEFWTELANELYDVFAKSGAIRNEILAIWKSLEGRSDLFTRGGDKQGAFWNLYDSIIAVRDAISNAWDTIFPKSEYEDEADQVNDVAHNLKTFTSNLQKSTKKIKEFLETNTDLQRVLQGVFSIVKVFLATTQSIRYALDPLIYTLKEIALVISDLFGDLGDQISSMTGYGELLYTIATKINEILTNIFTVIDIPKILKKVISLLGSLLSIVKGVFSSITDFFKDNDKIVDFVSDISNGLKTLTGRIKDFFSQFKKGSNTTNDSSIAKTITGSENNSSLENIKNSADTTYGILDALKEFAISLLTLLKSLYSLVVGIISISAKLITLVAETLKNFAQSLIDIAHRQDEAILSLKGLLKIAAAIVIFVTLIKLFINLKWMAEYLKINVYAFLDEAATALSKIGTSKIIESIGHALISLAASFLLIIIGIKFLDNISWSSMLKAGTIFAVIIASVILLTKFSKQLDRSFSLLNKHSGFFSGRSKSTTLVELPGILLSLGITFLLIGKSLEYFKDIEGTEKAFWRVLAILGILVGTLVAMQLLNKKTKDGLKSVRQMMPSMFQFLGFALSLKIIVKAFTKISQLLTEINNTEVEKKLWDITWKISAIIAGLIVINNLTKKVNKASNAMGALSGATINLGSKIGFTLLGLASVLLSITLFVSVIAKYGDEATTGLIWISSIIGGILILCAILTAVINKGSSKLTNEKGFKLFQRQNNPIASLLSSIASLLFSVSVTLAILQHVSINKQMIGVLIGVASFVIVLIGILGLVSLAFRDRKSGLLKNKGTSSVMSTSNVMAQLIKSIAVLVLAMAAVVLVLSLLPDQSTVIKLGLGLMAFILIIIGMITLLASQMKKSKNTKLFGSFALITLSIIECVGALLLLSVALKHFQSSVVPDWELYGYLAAIFGLFALLGGISALTGNVLALGVALFFGAMAVSLAAFGVALYVLGWGLENLVPSMNELTEEGVRNLKNLLLWLSLTGVTGILGVLGNSSLGTGMEVLGWGLQNLAPSMKELTEEGVKNLKNLLLNLSLTGVTGILGIIGNSSLGAGMSNLAEGLTDLLAPLNDLTSDHIDKLCSLLKVLSGNIGGQFTSFGQGFLNWFGLSEGDKIKNAMKDIASGLSPLIDQLNRITSGGDAVSALADILALCSKTYNVDSFQKVINIINSIQIPNLSDLKSALSTINSLISKIASMNMSNDDLVIKPKIDLSEFENSYDRLSTMLNNLSGKATSLSSELAYKISAEKNQSRETGNVSNTTNNSYSDNYTITINVEAEDPAEFANEFDKILQKKRTSNKLAFGK